MANILEELLTTLAPIYLIIFIICSCFVYSSVTVLREKVKGYIFPYSDSIDARIFHTTILITSTSTCMGVIIIYCIKSSQSKELLSYLFWFSPVISIVLGVLISRFAGGYLLNAYYGHLGDDNGDVLVYNKHDKYKNKSKNRKIRRLRIYKNLKKEIRQVNKKSDMLNDMSRKIHSIDDYIKDKIRGDKKIAMDFTFKYMKIINKLNSLYGHDVKRDKLELQLNAVPGEGNGVFSLKEGFHLCISTDTWLVDASEPYTLLFMAYQHTWAAKYDSCKDISKKPVYILSNIDEACNYQALDRALQHAIKLCTRTLFNNHTRLSKALGISLFSEFENDVCEFPRAIRVIFSQHEKLVQSVYRNYDGEIAKELFRGPESKILNIWMPVEQKTRLDVARWRQNRVDGFHSPEPIPDQTDTYSGNHKNYFEIFDDYFRQQERAARKLAHLHISNNFTKTIDDGIPPIKDFLLAGDKCIIINGEHKDSISPGYKKFIYLSSLPIILMILHSQKILNFDWVYMASRHQNVGEEVLHETIEHFLDSTEEAHEDSQP